MSKEKAKKAPVRTLKEKRKLKKEKQAMMDGKKKVANL